MAEYSRAEAAKRSGVDLTYIDRLIELAIISPDRNDRLTKGDVRRVQMAQTLQNAGIALESLAAGIKSGHGDLGFMDAPTYERFAALSDETFEGLSRRASLPLNLLMLIREATGGAIPNPEDRVREDEVAVVPLIESWLAVGFRPVSIERTLRVLGDSLRRGRDGVGCLAVRPDGADARQGRQRHRYGRRRLLPGGREAGPGHR